MLVLGPFIVITGLSRPFGDALRKLVLAGLVRFVEGKRALRVERVR
jgi:hypothetical protein